MPTVEIDRVTGSQKIWYNSSHFLVVGGSALARLPGSLLAKQAREAAPPHPGI